VGALIRLARLEHDGAVTQERRVVSESRELTFDADIADPAALEVMLERLATELCAALQRNDRHGRTVSIKVRLDDFSTYTRARTLSRPVGAPQTLCEVAVGLLRASPPTRPVRLLGVRVAGLVESAPERQLTLAV
jgi:DNA polymerase-4